VIVGCRIFIAGATGAIGKRLTPLLRATGHHVTGMTRTEAGAESLRALDADPVIVDVFDAKALSCAVVAARPEIVIHQLTDLPRGLDPSKMGEARRRNARIRDEGTRNLVQAAIAAGARQLVAQSIAWAYAPGAGAHSEQDPLDADAEGDRGMTIKAVIALEELVLQSPPLAGVVLRYGQLYGSRTGAENAWGALPLHVDAAAYAALLAVDRGASGIFNIVEPNDQVATQKASAELGWHAGFRFTL
jgi:nucleoside-diphosphate-sugar epimerase